MDQEQFHIFFRRSGGFTGISTSVKIDSRELASGEAEDLKRLIVRSGFFEAVAFDNTFVHMPDLFRPLINYLVRVARASKKNR